MPDTPTPGEGWAVARLRPTDPERVLESAVREYRASVSDGDPEPHYGLSVFAVRREPDETDDEVLKRLIAAADVEVGLSNHRWIFLLADAEELLHVGFAFIKDGYPGETGPHYCVRLDPPDLARVERFLACFTERHRIADGG